MLAASGVQVRPVSAAREETDCLREVQVEGEALWAEAIEAVRTHMRWLDAEVGTGAGLVAVIVSEAREAEARRVFESEADCAEALVSVREKAPRLSVLTAQHAKGLEYDCVVLVEPNELLAEGPGSLYVAMTRPTHRLTLVHT